MLKRTIAQLLGAALLVPFVAASAHAQVVGTFQWQTQPYCNHVTLTLVQQGGMYQVTGIDDLCGAGAAPVTGTAVVVPGGVTVGVTVNLPTGQAAHLSSTVSVTSGSGPWSDADGNTGTFLLSGNAAGSPRPAPASATAVTVAQLSPTVYAGTGVAPTLARSDHLHDNRYYPRADADVLLAGKANAGEVLAAGTMLAWSFLPERNGLIFPVATTRAGRLDVRMGAWIQPTCSPNAGGSRAIFLVVDGVYLPSSWVYLSAATTFAGALTGVTTAVIPAGTHQIGYALECFGADTANYTSIMGNGTVSVVVIP